jgi:hypothetical protein
MPKAARRAAVEDIDPDALFKQCLDWESAMPPVESTHKDDDSSSSDSDSSEESSLSSESELETDARKEALAAVAGLLQPGQVQRKRRPRPVPGEESLVLGSTGVPVGADGVGLSVEGGPVAGGSVPKAVKVVEPLSALAAGLLEGRLAPAASDTRATVVGRADVRAKNLDVHSSAGPQWFGMKAATMTTEMKRDLEAIKTRQYLDPKRFYKTKKEDAKMGKRAKFFQVGTVQAGAFESRAASLTRREREPTILAGMLKDERVSAFTERTYRTVQEEALRSGSAAYRRHAKRALGADRKGRGEHRFEGKRVKRSSSRH